MICWPAYFTVAACSLGFAVLHAMRPEGLDSIAGMDGSATDEQAPQLVAAGHWCPSPRRTIGSDYTLAGCGAAVAADPDCRSTDAYRYFYMDAAGKCVCASEGNDCSSTRREGGSYSVYSIPVDDQAMPKNEECRSNSECSNHGKCDHCNSNTGILGACCRLESNGGRWHWGGAHGACDNVPESNFNSRGNHHCVLLTDVPKNDNCRSTCGTKGKCAHCDSHYGKKGACCRLEHDGTHWSPGEQPECETVPLSAFKRRGSHHCVLLPDNICKCTGGTPASPADCPSDGADKCATCDAGYTLTDGSCMQACYDIEPQAHWNANSCQKQLDQGKCARRLELGDGICAKTCGHCQALKDELFSLEGENIECGDWSSGGHSAPDECRQKCEDDALCKAYRTWEQNKAVSGYQCLIYRKNDCSSAFQRNVFLDGKVLAYSKKVAVQGQASMAVQEQSQPDGTWYARPLLAAVVPVILASIAIAAA